MAAALAAAAPMVAELSADAAAQAAAPLQAARGFLAPPLAPTGHVPAASAPTSLTASRAYGAVHSGMAQSAVAVAAQQHPAWAAARWRLRPAARLAGSRAARQRPLCAWLPPRRTAAPPSEWRGQVAYPVLGHRHRAFVLRGEARAAPQLAPSAPTDSAPSWHGQASRPEALPLDRWPKRGTRRGLAARRCARAAMAERRLRLKSIRMASNLCRAGAARHRRSPAAASMRALPPTSARCQRGRRGGMATATRRRLHAGYTRSPPTSRWATDLQKGRMMKEGERTCLSRLTEAPRSARPRVPRSPLKANCVKPMRGTGSWSSTSRARDSTLTTPSALRRRPKPRSPAGPGTRLSLAKRLPSACAGPKRPLHGRGGARLAWSRRSTISIVTMKRNGSTTSTNSPTCVRAPRRGRTNWRRWPGRRPSSSAPRRLGWGGTSTPSRSGP